MNLLSKSFEHQNLEDNVENNNFLNTRNALSALLLSDLDNEINQTTSSQNQPWSAGFRNKLNILLLSADDFYTSKRITEEAYESTKAKIADLEAKLDSDDYTSQNPQRMELINDLRFVGAELLHLAEKF